MLILPLRFVREEDKRVIGINLFNLARLNHLGLPVIESVIAVPPGSYFNIVLDKFSHHKDNLKDYAGNLKRAILGIKMPESLENFNVVHFSESKKSIKVNTSKLWQNLLNKWSDELMSKIERGEKNLLEFTPQLIIFSSDFSGFGRGYFDEERDHVVIKTENGSLDFNKSQEIENLIILGNRKLILPQVYYWAVEGGKTKIIKVTPFTQSLPDEKEKIETPVQVVQKIREVKTATNILLDYNGGVFPDTNCDGILLRIQKTGVDFVNELISGIYKTQPNLKIIFSPEYSEDEFKNLEFAKTFLFFRNKKKFDVSLVLPKTYALDEYLKLKTDFASLGIYSKGSLKIWKQFSTVGDFLMMDEYLEAGFDGAIIDLDEIARIVTGVNPVEIKNQPKFDWIKSIEKFLKELGLSRIVKLNKPVLITGSLAENEELLNYFIKSGIWGLAYQKNIIDSFKEHTAYLEKLTLKKLTAAEINK